MFIQNKYLFSHLFYPVDFVTDWMNMKEFIQFCQANKVPPLARLILSSDGSLVRFLQALFLREINIQVVDQKEIPMDTHMGEFLEVQEGLKTVERQAWLCVEKTKLVFAHSFINATGSDGKILEDIWKRESPMGSLLRDNDIPVIRDRLGIARIKNDSLAREFKTVDDILWSRFYRFIGGDGFRAAIFEIFSPALFSVQ